MVCCTVMCEISTNSKSCFIFSNLPHLKAELVFIRWWQAAVVGSSPLWRLSSVCHTVSVHSTPPLPFLNCNPHIWAKLKIGRCVYLDWRQCFLKLQIRLWHLLEDYRGGYVCCTHEHPTSISGHGMSLYGGWEETLECIISVFGNAIGNICFSCR